MCIFSCMCLCKNFSSDSVLIPYLASHTCFSTAVLFSVTTVRDESFAFPKQSTAFYTSNLMERPPLVVSPANWALQYPCWIAQVPLEPRHMAGVIISAAHQLVKNWMFLIIPRSAEIAIFSSLVNVSVSNLCHHFKSAAYFYWPWIMFCCCYLASFLHFFLDIQEKSSIFKLDWILE